MAGHRAERKSPGADWKAPSAAVATAAAIFASVLLALLAGWPSVTVTLPAPPTWFLLALALIAASSAGAYAILRSRDRRPAPRAAPGPRAARAAPRGPVAKVDPVRKDEDLDAFLTEIAEGPVAPVTLPLAAAEADPAEFDLSKLEEWLDTVTAQVSEWAAIASSLDEPVAAPAASIEEASDGGPESWTPVLVSVGDDDGAEPRPGAWTEPKARTAIERYLRMKPWAHATTVAEALDMDLRLALRVIGSLRRDGGL